MFWLSFLIFYSTANSVTYLTFNSTSNPSNLTISLPCANLTGFSYSIEFWFRPSFKLIDSSGKLVIQTTNSWNASYSIINQSLTFINNQTQYCTLSKILNNTWNHIALIYTTGSPQSFSCYINGTLNSSLTLPLTNIVYPTALVIGYNFYGNILDLRV